CATFAPAQASNLSKILSYIRHNPAIRKGCVKADDDPRFRGIDCESRTAIKDGAKARVGISSGVRAPHAAVDSPAAVTDAPGGAHCAGKANHVLRQRIMSAIG